MRLESRSRTAASTDLAYIVRYADMPGFSKMDQERLAVLLLGQRGKLEKLPVQQATDPIWRLVFCLRLSTLLHRSRDDQGLPVCFVRQSGTGFQVELPGDWLTANPLSAATLNEEALLWQRWGRRSRSSAQRVLQSGIVSMANATIATGDRDGLPEVLLGHLIQLLVFLKF